MSSPVMIFVCPHGNESRESCEFCEQQRYLNDTCRTALDRVKELETQVATASQALTRYTMMENEDARVMLQRMQKLEAVATAARELMLCNYPNDSGSPAGECDLCGSPVEPTHKDDCVWDAVVKALALLDAGAVVK